MLLVNDTEEINGSETARIVIDSRSGTKYVSAMELPQFEVALHFAPPATPGKELAAVQTASAAGSAR
jgi:hypothetical protein